MISFNLKDYQLSAIRRESKLSNMRTKNEFRVYGLAQQYKNPPILIEAQAAVWENRQEELMELKNFFDSQGLPNQIGIDETIEDQTIFIGLRRDLRDHTLLSTAVLQTIVYQLENRLDLNNEFKVPGIPKLVPRATKTRSKPKQK